MTVALVAANVIVFLIVTNPMSAERPHPEDPLLYEYLRAISDSLPPGVPLLEVARQTTLYDLFVFEFGFRPAAMSVATLFSAMFLHAGLLHLAGNMLSSSPREWAGSRTARTSAASSRGLPWRGSCGGRSGVNSEQ